MSVSFYGNSGGETTGGVADRIADTAKHETTGGIGVRRNNDSIFMAEDRLMQDTVNFKAYNEPKKKASTTSIIFGTTAGIATTIGLLGLAHKYNVVDKMFKDGKVKDFFKHSEAITEPCYKACSWVKNNCYDKVINFFRKK